MGWNISCHTTEESCHFLKCIVSCLVIMQMWCLQLIIFLSASALFMYPKMLINSNIIYILYWKLSSCRSHGLLVYTLRFSASTNPPRNVICSCSPSLTPYHFLPSPYSSLNMEWHTARNKEKSHKYRSVKEYLTL